MAMAQGSALRHLIMSNRDFATLMVAGLSAAALDAPDEIRLNALFNEVTYMARQVLDRVKHGVAPPDEFERGVVPQIAVVLSTTYGVQWWRRSKGFQPTPFVAALEALIPALAEPGAAAAPAETNPAPPVEAG
jgi:hypothetical protein